MPSEMRQLNVRVPDDVFEWLEGLRRHYETETSTETTTAEALTRTVREAARLRGVSRQPAPRRQPGRPRKSAG